MPIERKVLREHMNKPSHCKSNCNSLKVKLLVKATAGQYTEGNLHSVIEPGPDLFHLDNIHIQISQGLKCWLNNSFQLIMLCFLNREVQNEENDILFIPF